MDDHDILIELQRDICWIKKMVENHLKHHFMITLCSLGTALTVIGGIVLLLIKRE